jgi:hypothetical protein
MKERKLRVTEVPPPKVVQFYAAVRFDVMECTLYCAVRASEVQINCFNLFISFDE